MLRPIVMKQLKCCFRGGGGLKTGYLGGGGGVSYTTFEDTSEFVIVNLKLYSNDSKIILQFVAGTNFVSIVVH